MVVLYLFKKLQGNLHALYLYEFIVGDYVPRENVSIIRLQDHSLIAIHVFHSRVETQTTILDGAIY